MDASNISIHLPRSRSAVTAANVRSLFPWTEVSKAVQKPNGGQEVPEIALSVGSKLELLRAFVFAKCPYTSPYTHAFVRVCVYIHIVHDRGAEGFAL